MRHENATDIIRKHICESWDRGAWTYDTHYAHGLKSEAEREAWLRLLRELVPPQRPCKVLDVGTGTGFLAFLLSELGHEVIGMDLSEGMLRVARRRAAASDSRTAFMIGDAAALPCGDGEFDVVISRHLLWTLLEPKTALTEWRRVVRSGGSIVAIDVLARGGRLSVRLGTLIGRALKALRRETKRCDHAYPEGIYSRLPLMDLTDPEPVRAVFREAGLEVTRLEELDWLDAVERRAMPLSERLSNPYRRYLIVGNKNGTPA